jgi:sugar transferase (PEP-CTERM/EpsH1 system associated)
MAKLLFLSHRIPYPPDKGDKIRSWHILRHLAERNEVHLGAFIDDPEDEKHIPFLGDLCASTKFIALHPKTARLKSLRGLLSGDPLSLHYYRSPEMAAWAEGKLKEGIERIFLFSSPVAQFVLGKTACRTVMDFVDIDSDKWAQYAGSRKGLARWIYGREAKTLLPYERKVAASVDAGLFVSKEEAALFRTLAPEVAGKIHALANGVDHAYFSPDPGFANPYPEGAPLVFTGAMDYWANVDAVTWFARDIFPRIRRARGDALFFIVGGRPASAVTALGELPGVTVTGRVPDVRPYLAHARAVVAPLRIARGVQNKVLEGMAMARPVIATTQAAEGIECLAGKELWMQDDEAEFAEAALKALDTKGAEPLATRARARILRSYDWAANLSGLDGLLGLEESRAMEPCDVT